MDVGNRFYDSCGWKNESAQIYQVRQQSSNELAGWWTEARTRTGQYLQQVAQVMANTGQKKVALNALM